MDEDARVPNPGSTVGMSNQNDTPLRPELTISGPHGVAALLEPELYRAFFEAVHHQMAAGLVVAEAPGGRLVYWNRRVEALLGRPLDASGSALEYDQYEARRPDGTRYFAHEYPLARALAGETVREEQMTYPRPDGTSAQFSVSASPVRGADGAITYAVCTFTDISGHVEREDQLRAMAETMPQLVWSTRPDGTPDWYNRRWYRFTGMAALDGRPVEKSPFEWTRYVHPEDKARVTEAWRQAVEKTARYEVEYRLREAASGEYRWVLARGHPLRDETGAIVRWFGTCTDVDEQHRAGERARRLERAATRMLAATTVDEVVRVAILESTAALEAGGAAINLYDESTRTLRIAGASDDPAGQASLRWGPIPIDGNFLVSRAARTGEIQTLTGTADFDRTSAEAAAALRSMGVGAAAFCPMRVGDRLIGTIGFVFPREGPFHSEQLAFMEGLASQCAHALDRARLFEEARAARAEAERANKAKSDFLAVMSHELRSPLNAIDGHAALVMDGVHGPVNENQVNALQRLRRSSGILLGLINDLLDFSRIEAGRVHYNTKRVALQPLLDQLDELVQPQARERSLRWTPATVPADVHVLADADKVLQVLINLTTNALKFTPSGGSVELVAEPGDDTVRLSVRDTGIGIPPHMHELVFDPFVQVDQGRTRQRQGVGLGLAISRDLARGMNGDLTVQSEQGVGSTFTLTLPRA